MAVVTKDTWAEAAVYLPQKKLQGQGWPYSLPCALAVPAGRYPELCTAEFLALFRRQFPCTHYWTPMPHFLAPVGMPLESTST